MFDIINGAGWGVKVSFRVAFGGMKKIQGTCGDPLMTIAATGIAVN